MYQKIATIMNRDYGSDDLSADDVENYLRHGDMTYITPAEAQQIETLLERYL